MTTNEPACETCGAPATHGVRDIKESPPDNSPWRQFEPDGEPHFYCAKHSRQSRTTRLDGSVETPGDLTLLVATRVIRRLKRG